MAFKIVYGDIIEMKVEAIVNSLGVNSRIPGAICKNVALNAKSKEVDDLLASHPNGHIFDMYVTDAGLLPAKHIIHIVTPFKDDDDANVSNLTKAYQLVIDKAIELGYKTIAIPFLGTGANGYRGADVYKAASVVGEKYSKDSDDEVDDIDITVTIYNKKIEDRKNRRYCIEHEYNIRYLEANNLLNDQGKPIQHELILSSYMNKIFGTVHRNEIFKPTGFITCAFDFLEDYVLSIGLKKADIFMNIMSRNEASKCRRKIRNMTKKEIFKASAAFGLNRTVFLQLMSLAGYSFSSLNKTDVWFYNYYSRNEIAKNMFDFFDLYYDDDIIAELFEE